MMRLLSIVVAAASVLLVACSSVSRMTSGMGSPEILQVNPDTRPGGSVLLRSGSPIRLLVSEPKDARGAAANTRKVGQIRATVSDMYGPELTLDREVSALTGSTLRSQLSSDGFSVVASGQAYDFEVTTLIRTFDLNIAGRDELSMVVEASLREPTGTVIWSGIVNEKSDRFAGVMGNSRSSITDYLGQGLANLVQKVTSSVRSGLVQSYPQTVMASQQRSPAVLAATGVTTLTPASAREGVVAKVPAPVALPTPIQPALMAPALLPGKSVEPGRTKLDDKPSVLSAALPGYGYVLMITNPTRVKVYSDDIYYGLTPLKVMVPVGVMTFEFRFDGYKTVKEKISVRAAEVTELELNLKK